MVSVAFRKFGSSLAVVAMAMLCLWVAPTAISAELNVTDEDALEFFRLAEIAAGPNGQAQAQAEAALQRLLERMAPELKGKDPDSPEYSELIPSIMQRFMTSPAGTRALMKQAEKPEIQAQAARLVQDNHNRQAAKLASDLGFSLDEFAAVFPMIERIKILRRQKYLVDDGKITFADYGVTEMPLNEAMVGELDPTIVTIRETSRRLQALITDPQSNNAEMVSSVQSLRRARQEFSELLRKAQDALRSVLNARQEAMLVAERILD